MRQIRAWIHRFGGIFRRSRREQEISEEIESNIALHIEDNVRAGMSPGEAHRRAILEFGGIESTKQDCRDRLGLPFVETVLYDLRYAARSLARSRIFAAAAVATLAFGIGASTTMFSVAKAILLPPLPYVHSDRLVAIEEVDRLKPSQGNQVASADFSEWQQSNTVFSGMSAYVGMDERGKARYDLLLTGNGEARVLKGLAVRSNLFELLGVQPALGRAFIEKDEAADQTAILSYDCWRSEFAADPQIIGRPIQLGGVTRTVIGVMPRGFFFPNNEVEVFVPPGAFTPDRVFYDEGVIARLRPGVSIEQARAAMATVGARLQREYPNTNASLDVRTEIYHSSLSTKSRPAVMLLFAAVGILFVMVCANVAHLQLGRAASRVQEFAIRKALGASRGRLVRQLLTEGLLLSAAGGVLGFALASAAHAALQRFAPETIPSYADFQMDAWVIVFNLAVTLLAPLLFGIGPALSAAHPDDFRSRGESSANTSRRVRALLVGGEVALCVVLTVCAGLLIRSFVNLENVDLGFRTENTLSFRLDLTGLVPTEDQGAQQYLEIENRLLEQPGIVAAGATARPLLGGGAGGDADVTIQGREHSLRLELVTPGYFLALRTPLLRGRFPNLSDTKKSGLIVVVNSAFERIYFPDKNAVGKQILLGRWTATIVGVVADLKQEGIDVPAQPAAFASSAQISPRAVTFIVRGYGDRQTLLTSARAAVHSINKAAPLIHVATLDELVQASISGQRIRTSLLSLFAGAALFLAALGVYGVLAYAVVQRSTEISIRMALGAPRRRLFGMIVLDGMRPVLTGAILGFAGAYAAGTLMRSLLFGTAPADPSTYLLTVLILTMVSLFACAIPAINAIRLDPMVSLRRQ